MAGVRSGGPYFAWYTTPFSKKRRCVRLYRAYINMLSRTRGQIKDGTGKARWKEIPVKFTGFTEFRSWALANGYRKGLVLDRKHELAEYGPGNCQWITAVANRNKAANIHRDRCKCFWCKAKRSIK